MTYIDVHCTRCGLNDYAEKGDTVWICYGCGKKVVIKEQYDEIL